MNIFGTMKVSFVHYFFISFQNFTLFRQTFCSWNAMKSIFYSFLYPSGKSILSFARLW
jgi:hypothetical protein